MAEGSDSDLPVMPGTFDVEDEDLQSAGSPRSNEEASTHEITGVPCRKFTAPVRRDFTYSVERQSEYDLTIITSDDIKFKVQSQALCDQSEYFVALLASGMSEERSRVVAFQDIDSTALEGFVNFACTGKVVVDGDSFLPLLQLGSRLICGELLSILKSYIQTDFINVKEEDLSIILSSPLHPEIEQLTRKLLLEHLIGCQMFRLSFEVVASLLKDDDLVSSTEDEILQYVREYCKLWDLESDKQRQLLETVRLPRLTMAAFEKAAISVQGFKDCKAFEAIVNRMEFLDVVAEDQLRPRKGNKVHVTMLWIGEVHETRSGIFSIVRPLVISSTGTATTELPNRFIDVDRSFLAGYDFFSSSPYVSIANHLFSITSFGSIEKLTFRKHSLKKCPKPNSCCHNEVMDIEVVIGVDCEEDYFYLSCLKAGVRKEKLVVLKCQFVQKDDLRTERVELPPQVISVRAHRMIYKQNAICILDSLNNLYVFKPGSQELFKVPDPDHNKPRYNQIAVQDDRLYVFDYSECPVHLHDFSQPFSHFDKVRLFDLSKLEWVACYEANLNELRQTGYNELIDFNVDMYFIRKQLYFSWTYQARLYLFRVNETQGRIERIFDCKVPRDTNGVILLPGFFTSHAETTVVEKYVNSFCLKKLEVVGENRLDCRRVVRWREKYLDGVSGSGLFPSALDSAWHRT